MNACTTDAADKEERTSSRGVLSHRGNFSALKTKDLHLCVFCGCMRFVSTPSMLECITAKSVSKQGHCTSHSARWSTESWRLKEATDTARYEYVNLRACCGNDAISQKNPNIAMRSHKHSRRNDTSGLTCGSETFVESVLQVQLRRPRLHRFLHGGNIQISSSKRDNSHINWSKNAKTRRTILTVFTPHFCP